MKPLSTLLSSKQAPSRRWTVNRRREVDKPAAPPRPAPKRSLNEGAHKIDR